MDKLKLLLSEIENFQKDICELQGKIKMCEETINLALEASAECIRICEEAEIKI